MEILVTGGAGFIGSNLVFELDKLGHNVTVVDTLHSKNNANLNGFNGEIIESDVSKGLKLNKKFDAIFHEASITDTTFKDDTQMYRQNIVGFIEVLNLALKNNSKLIYASSAGVYGNGEFPMKEDQKLAPLNSYAHSKKIMDDIAARFSDSINLIGLRYFNVFGPRELYKGKSSSMIFQLGMKMKSGIRPRVFTHGEQKRDHIYVKDVVKANLLALKSDKGGIYNVGTGVATDFNELIIALNDVLGTSFEPEYFENSIEKVYQNHTLADTKKAEQEIGFTCDYSFKKGVEEYMKMLDEGKNE